MTLEDFLEELHQLPRSAWTASVTVPTRTDPNGVAINRVTYESGIVTLLIDADADDDDVESWDADDDAALAAITHALQGTKR